MQDNYELKRTKDYRNSMPYNDGWKVKSGHLGFKMCNDYLFRATTWEELKMLAQEDKTIDKALSTVWQLTEDERIRDQMQRREDSERYWNALLKDVSDTKQALEEKTQELAESNRALSEKTLALENAEQEIALLKAELAARDKG